MFFWCRQHKLDQRMVRHQLGAVPLFFAPVVLAMSGLPDFLKVPEGTAKLSSPPANMPVLKLIKLIAVEKKIEFFALFSGFL
jgi:hypothetical protein